MEIKDKEQDELLHNLATLIAAYTNPQVHPFDIGTLPEAERLAELNYLKLLMGEILG